MARTNKGSQQQANYYFDRGNPEPLDSSMLYNSYSDLKAEIGKGETSIAFAGMYTAVEGNNGNNGPYYINKYKNPERIVLKSEADITYKNMLSYVAKTNAMLYSMLEQPKYTKPNITVQFLSATDDSQFTPISNSETIYEDVEICSYFTAGIKINWPKRTLTNESGTRSSYAYGYCDTNTPNQLLGYSYGLNGKGISFKFIGSPKTDKILDDAIIYPVFLGSENSITVFSDISISYLEASYMYYPQFYKNKKYEIAPGENDTKWFGKGVYKPKTQQYIVTGKYRYYWGFSNESPKNNEEVKKGNSGLLNNTSLLNSSTITSCVVGDGYDKKCFWVAFPKNYYDIIEYNDNYKILLEQIDGFMFDLVGHNQQFNSKECSVTLGNQSAEIPYKIAYLNFEYPIGNKSSVISFRIASKEVSNYIFSMSDDNNNVFCLDGSTNTLTTEIYDDKLCKEEELNI